VDISSVSRPHPGGGRRQLQQVVWNLVSNAVKFTDKGGFVAWGAWSSTASGAVTDARIGIRRPSCRVFERFRRQMALPPRPRGLGLGLTITRHIVSSMAGRGDQPVRAGARFTVRLPIRSIDREVCGRGRSFGSCISGSESLIRKHQLVGRRPLGDRPPGPGSSERESADGEMARALRRQRQRCW
jgi:hypothetical protein